MNQSIEECNTSAALNGGLYPPKDFADLKTFVNEIDFKGDAEELSKSLFLSHFKTMMMEDLAQISSISNTEIVITKKPADGEEDQEVDPRKGTGIVAVDPYIPDEDVSSIRSILQELQSGSAEDLLFTANRLLPAIE